MRIVLDQGVPRDTGNLLRERGYECLHVGEIGMSQATDEEIIAWSLTQKATVVTLDADFHAIIAVSRAAAPSVIRIRTQGLDAPAVAASVQEVFAAFEPLLKRGSLITVKAKKTTCHKLPIGSAE